MTSPLGWPTMRRRRMGTSGLAVPDLSLGTWMWGSAVTPQDARDLLTTYLDAGGNALDTAAGYGRGASETTIGGLLGDVVARDELVLTTKAGQHDASRRTLARELDGSLRRLGTDHVDLFLVQAWSDAAPVEETLATLDWAVTTGRARYVGVSNYSGWQTGYAASLAARAGSPLVCNQVEYSLLNRLVEDEVVPAAQHLGLGLAAWSPLGGGVLSGKYRHGIPADSRAASRLFPGFAARSLDAGARRIADAVVTAAEGLGVSATEVALAWVRDRPGVSTAVLGARTVAQLRTCLAAARLELPDELVQALTDVSY
ncbi:MAG TPA: aldo/keto reductase [Dermatophilaceae bacterium]|nr:aldo/keto reductase [Dermatophilaceae bacterium]